MFIQIKGNLWLLDGEIKPPDKPTGYFKKFDFLKNYRIPILHVEFILLQ